MVVNEMRGEKIDIVPFSEDLADFVAKALSPAKVTAVHISEDGTAADVIVPDHQLSLAIGREGQNARLAARLTGVRVDIRSETQLAEGIPAGGRDADVEYADGEWRANAETGEMEWHAADGSVISESDWQAQAAAASEAARRRGRGDGRRSASETPAPTSRQTRTQLPREAPATRQTRREKEAKRTPMPVTDDVDDSNESVIAEAKRTTSPPPRTAATTEWCCSSRTRPHLHRLPAAAPAVCARACHENG